VLVDAADHEASREGRLPSSGGVPTAFNAQVRPPACRLPHPRPRGSLAGSPVQAHARDHQELRSTRG
jgi:hypothetical protein